MTDKSSLKKLDELILARIENPQDGYTDKLIADRNLRMKKIGEEASEFIVACVDKDTKEIANEGADVFYHVLVSARSCGVSLEDILKVLEDRAN